MPPILSGSEHRRPSRSDHLLRLGEVALRFGAEAYGQWWTITSRCWAYEVDRVVRGALSSVGPEALLRGMASGYVNCLGELAAVVPSVAEKAAMELTRRSDTGLEPYIGDENAGPEPDEEIFDVDGKPFAMPARVLDASQGWAMFFVDTEAANRSLGTAREIVSAFDAGGGRTPLMLVGVDYRNSDFGVYPEFVVAVTVTANGDPAKQLFTYYLAIVVTQEFTKEAARIVWGLEKIVCPSSRSVMPRTACYSGYRTRRARCWQFASRASAMHGLPMCRSFPSLNVGVGPERRTYWAMTTKSGSGEGTQIGGSVMLELGMPGDGLCLCADGKSVCLCDMLRSFNIADRLPAANRLDGAADRTLWSASVAGFSSIRCRVQRSSVGKNPGEICTHHGIDH